MPEMKRSARLALLRSLLEEGEFASQHELSAALVERDVEVSQSTLSKDLLVLGAVKRRTADGSLVYAVGDESEGGGVAAEKLARRCAELLQSIQHAANQIVVKTPPGAAQFLGAHVGRARLPGVMGTVAGDDTLLLVTTDPESAVRTAGIIAHMTRTGKPTRLRNLGREEQ